MCNTSHALGVPVLWKQTSLEQTSETVSAKRQIAQIVTQWVPGSRASNNECPTTVRAEIVSRHNQVMTTGGTKMSSTGHIGDRNAIRHWGAFWWRQLRTIDTSLYFTRSGTSSQWRSSCSSCVNLRSNFLVPLTRRAAEFKSAYSMEERDRDTWQKSSVWQRSARSWPPPRRRRVTICI